MSRSGKRLRAAGHIIYKECRSLSAPLRPSAPRGRGLRRHPSVRQPPFVAPFPQGRAPFGQGRCEKLAVFRFSPPLFREKPTFPKNAPAFCSPRLADGLTPTAEAQGENFTSPRRKCAFPRTRSLFFNFGRFRTEKTRYICSENLFYQLRMAKVRPFVPIFVCPPECPDTSLPSL